MRKMNLFAMVMAVLLLAGFGATNLSAEMKCGAGKCGSAMVEKPACKTVSAKPGPCQCPDTAKCSCKNTANCTCNQSPACKNCDKRPANCACADKSKCSCKGPSCNCNVPAAKKCGSGN